jgi:myo-inositol 2-dehydrogenase / D-chiro-inositol 1-dehydrogenase
MTTPAVAFTSVTAAPGSSSAWLAGSRVPRRGSANCQNVAIAPRAARPCTRMSVPVPPTSGTVPIQSLSALIVPENEPRLRIGVIGAGRIGHVHADNITFRLRNAVLVGVQSGSQVLAERCSLEHGCKPYYDYHEMLENPEVDAVCICSASNKHTEHIIAAAEAGKHIFCEKPIDTDLAQIDKALVAVRKAGVKLQVGFNRRFDTNYARVRAALVDGEIGQPHMIHITSRDPSPPSLEYVKNSGGIWLDCAIHDMDMCRFLIGDEVDEVYALGAVNIDPEIAKYGDVDTSVVTLRFRNGVIGTIDNSRQAVYGYDQRCEVLGSGGSIHINNNYNNSAVISDSKAVKRDLPLHFFMERYTDSFILEMDQFCDAVLHNKPIPCTGLDGRAPVVIALAAKKSYLDGRPVKLSECDIPMPAELSGWDGQ